MLDPFDYKEPSCALCGGKEFYYPSEDTPVESIPIRKITEKLDAAFEKNDYTEAERLLDYWENEARALKDKRGELGIISEKTGFYRKTGNEKKGLESVYRGLELIEELGLTESVSGATVMLNAATTLKAFGKASEALPLYEKVKRVYEKELDAFDGRIAGLCNNAALAYVDAGDFAKAENLYLKALDILSHNQKSENEIAITYVNLAHLYENIEEKQDKVYECIEKAIEYLDSPETERNGYHAFVCSKCAPSIGYFGYFVAKERLDNRVKEIYERN